MNRFGLLLVLGGFVVTATGDQPAAGPIPPTRQAKTSVYTCAMHPQIRLPEPGKCPICALELMPAFAEAALKEEGQISVQKEQLVEFCRKYVHDRLDNLTETY